MVPSTANPASSARRAQSSMSARSVSRAIVFGNPIPSCTVLPFSDGGHFRPCLSHLTLRGTRIDPARQRVENEGARATWRVATGTTEELGARQVSADEAVGLIRPGDNVFVGSACATPRSL